MTHSSLSPRPLLILGDTVVLALFSLLGRGTHNMGNSLESIVHTALPFALAWYLVATVTGAYGEQATARPATAAWMAGRAWLIAFPLALLLRALMLGRGTHWSFAMVAGAFLLAAFTGWRAALATRGPLTADPS